MQTSTATTSRIIKQQVSILSSNKAAVVDVPKNNHRYDYTEEEADDQDVKSVAITLLCLPCFFLVGLALIIWACI